MPLAAFLWSGGGAVKNKASRSEGVPQKSAVCGVGQKMLHGKSPDKFHGYEKDGLALARAAGDSEK